jgi:hypothetical protein
MPDLKSRLRLGSMVFVTLVSIKIGEYLLATFIRSGDWPYLTVLALLSAGLIAYFYKHIHQLWRFGGKDGE